MPNTSHSLPRIRIRGRSFLALVLTPEAPLSNWFTSLDGQIERSSNFFFGKPVILNLELLTKNEDGLEHLYDALIQRHIQIISIEGGDSSWSALSKWPQNFTFSDGRHVENLDPPDDTQTKNKSIPCYIVDEPVRSGQSILFPEGDVIIVNSVASGAEIVAGGSIHVYGALRGRAIAGISGQSKSRIFANQMRAELLAIDGFYMTADEIPSDLIGKPAQVYLNADIIVVDPLLKVK